ncbi:MAG: Holliday junction resolvase RuvX [Actinobacteria bacterium]|nr:Holliday junction resolvase RuvX [Actinomycetota bacterium]
MRGRRLAFDYGDSRIGVAVCDADGILATPLPVLENREQSLSTSLKQLLSEYEPVHVFIGLPINMSGTSGQAAEKVEKFAEKIREQYAIPVIYVDERLSTVSAQRKLKEAGVSSKDSKSLIDSMAAVAILEQGLLQETAKNPDNDRN